MIRHGETDSNKRGTYLGWTNAKLNERGMEQAISIGEKLKDVRIDAIYASPLIRASATAEMIARHHKIEISYDERLQERNFGIWEDLSHQDIVERHKKAYDQWCNDWIHYVIDNGESAWMVFRRNQQAIKAIMDKHEAGRVLVVTHLGCIRNVLAYLFEMGIEGSWRFSVENGGMTKVAIDNGYAVLKL